jgi:hypothetical protein
VISAGQIVTAGLVTAVAVAIAARAVRWPRASLLLAAAGAFVLIVAWRAVCNLLGLNGDFVPAISIADTACLAFGGLAPAVVAAATTVPGRVRWMPAVVGAAVGFLVNVVIL